MKLNKLFLFSVIIFSLLFSNLAFANIPIEGEKQIEAIEKYSQIMESFAKTRADGYPDYYAGAYLGDSEELVILTTDMNMAQNSLSDSNVRFEMAEYSMNELRNIDDIIYNYITNNKDEEITSKISGFGIDEYQNKMSVFLTDISDEVLQEFREKIVDSEAVTFNKRDKLNFNATYHLGSQFYYKKATSTFLYSMGFRAKRVVGGTTYNGFVTAGHSMPDGATIYSAAGSRIGYVKGVSFGDGSDASFVCADSATISSKTTTGYDINGSDYVTSYLTRAVVFKNGYATGQTTGRITNPNFSFVVDSITVKNVVAADYEAKNGDSGGLVWMPFSNGNLPAGVHSASGNGVSCFVKVKTVVDKLGVTPY